MPDGNREDSQAPPDVSGVFFHPETVERLGRPIFARFKEGLDDGEQAQILAAVAKMRRQSAQVPPEVVQEILCGEVLSRVLSHRAKGLGLSRDEVDRDLVRSRAQLDAMRDGSGPKRVYYTVSALHRCATRAQEREVIACSCRALRMPRNNVDVYKRRALQRVAANTCFARAERDGGRELLGELHLFFLDLEPPLRAASHALLEAYCRRGSLDASARTAGAHHERNRLRKIYDHGCKKAKRIWTTQLPEALDASCMRPIDADAELSAELHSVGLSPEQIARRVDGRWQALKISWTVPKRILPTTTWRSILATADRPPTWVLEGEWRQLLRGRGLLVEDAWRSLVDAAKEADGAHAAWIQGVEDCFEATQDDPAPLKDAVERFNLTLDELLTRSARGCVSR